MIRQLLLGVVIVSLFIAVSGGIALRIALDYEKAIAQLYDRHVQGAVHLAEANDALWRLRYGFLRLFVQMLIQNQIKPD